MLLIFIKSGILIVDHLIVNPLHSVLAGYLEKAKFTPTRFRNLTKLINLPSPNLTKLVIILPFPNLTLVPRYRLIPAYLTQPYPYSVCRSNMYAVAKTVLYAIMNYVHVISPLVVESESDTCQLSMRVAAVLLKLVVV